MRHAGPFLILGLAFTVACDPAPDAGAPGTRESGSDVSSGVDTPTADMDRENEPPGAAEGSRASGRVVFLGTSLTAGYGLADPAEEGWVGRIRDRVDSLGLPLEVTNAGVSGDTSAGGLARLDWILRRPVDVLVVELGANDGLRGQSPAALEENLRAIVARTRARYPDAAVVLVGMEAPPNLGTAYVDDFRAVFTRVAREMDTALVPFLLEDVAGDPALNQADGIHPTAAGHARMAETVWPVLAPVLRRAGETGP